MTKPAQRTSFEDNPAWDGTDAAHPAWWRGQDWGVQATIQRLRAVLRGEDNGSGVSGSASLDVLRHELRDLRDVLDELRGPCPHTSFTGTDDPNVWECDGCHRLRRDVLDPEGPVEVWDGHDNRRRVRQEWLPLPASPVPNLLVARRPEAYTEVYRFTVPILPPGVNHQYRMTERRGAKALTALAIDLRKHFTIGAQRVGFEPRLDRTYHVAVGFTMPGWSQDIDGPVKALLDAVFTAPGHTNAWDHRITDLHVTKEVKPGHSQTDMIIWEFA